MGVKKQLYKGQERERARRRRMSFRAKLQELKKLTEPGVLLHDAVRKKLVSPKRTTTRRVAG